eukprot:131109_1
MSLRMLFSTILISTMSISVMGIWWWYLNIDINVIEPVKNDEPVDVNTNDKIAIKISIASSCQEKEIYLRRNQRSSWLNYLDETNEEWSDLHNRCKVSYNFVIGNCPNDTIHSQIQHEMNTHHDIARIKVNESWTNLQKKTIQTILWEYENTDYFDLLLK